MQAWVGGDIGPQMIGSVFNNDDDQAWASLDRVENIDATTLLPGHGSPWKGTPADAVGLARERASTQT